MFQRKNNNVISKDFEKIKKNLNPNSKFYEKQKTIKDKLKDNYNKDYNDEQLIKRLRYLQRELSLYQSFYISLFMGAIFFGLSFIHSLVIIIIYAIFIIVVYCLLRLHQKCFNEYQTNDFEINLIKEKLGIAENVKRYSIKLKNQGKKVKAIVDEMEIKEEL